MSEFCDPYEGGTVPAGFTASRVHLWWTGWDLPLQKPEVFSSSQLLLAADVWSFNTKQGFSFMEGGQPIFLNREVVIHVNFCS